MTLQVLIETAAIGLDALSYSGRENKELFSSHRYPADNHLLTTTLSGQLVHVLVHEAVIDVVHSAHERMRPIVSHRPNELVLHVLLFWA